MKTQIRITRSATCRSQTTTSGSTYTAQVYPGSTNSATISGNTTVDFTNPTYSANALAAYIAAGLPTPIVVSGTSGGAGETGTVPTTLLGNGYVSAHLGAAGSGETNFVGGYGPQVLLGGQGANILSLSATAATGCPLSIRRRT